MKEKELKPCPFCGGEAIINEVPPHKHKLFPNIPECKGETFIECTKCTCAISADTTEDAVNDWNRRTKE